MKRNNNHPHQIRPRARPNKTGAEFLRHPPLPPPAALKAPPVLVVARFLASTAMPRPAHLPLRSMKRWEGQFMLSLRICLPCPLVPDLLQNLTVQWVLLRKLNQELLLREILLPIFLLVLLNTQDSMLPSSQRHRCLQDPRKTTRVVEIALLSQRNCTPPSRQRLGLPPLTPRRTNLPPHNPSRPPLGVS